MPPGADAGRLSLLYVSNGNIPSRWAHTVQTMKMSESLAELVPSFRLLIATSLSERVRRRIDLWSWYGIERPFPIERLPLWLWRREPVFEGVLERRFSHVAPWRAERLRPALVWTRSYPVAEGCLRRGLPVLFERHSASPATWNPILARMGASPLLRGFVTNSEALFGAHREAGIPAAKLAAVGNAADPRLLRAERRDSSAARSALGLPKERAVALYAGSLSAAKGIQTLLDTAARLPAIHFALLGGGPDEVAHWRARAGSLANVEFRGFVARGELASWFAAADVALFPNSSADALARSTSPLKLFEYAAAGLPMVAAAIPAVSGWLREGDNAFLCRPDDPEDMARVLARALADPADAAARALRARASIAGFTWRARAERILAQFAPELLG